MDTFSIQRVLEKISDRYTKTYRKKLFFRVCACDLLPKRIPLNQDTIIIVNVDPSDSPGQHWQSIFVPRMTRECFFFDSYGQPPENKYIKSFINRYSRTFKWNKRRFQSFHSSCCGEYCCLFAWAAVLNRLRYFFGHFDNNVNNNDRKVQKSFNRLFNAEGCMQRCSSFVNCNKQDPACKNMF